MYAPRVFASMAAVMIVFAVATYLMTGSLLTTLIETALCAVILQVGYFIGIVYLVQREKAGESPEARQPRLAGEKAGHDVLPNEAAARLHVRDR